MLGFVLGGMRLCVSISTPIAFDTVEMRVDIIIANEVQCFQLVFFFFFTFDTKVMCISNSVSMHVHVYFHWRISEVF